MAHTLAHLWDCLAEAEQLPAQNPLLRTSNPLVQGSGSKPQRLSTWLEQQGQQLSAHQRAWAEPRTEPSQPGSVPPGLAEQAAALTQALECMKWYVDTPGEPHGEVVLPLDEEQLGVQMVARDEDRKVEAAWAESLADSHPRKACLRLRPAGRLAGRAVCGPAF